MKRILSFAMAVLMMIAALQPAVAASKVKSASLRLSAVEGTVKVTNKNGQDVTVTEDMKLYNGTIITTSAKSYAYISIDNDKAVKLDAGTQAEVRTAGKKLELRIITGKLFCNVKAPLKKDETLNISTSTTITGIRGTSLSIGSDGGQTQVQVYSGQVVTAVYNALGQIAQEMDVSLGQKLTVTESPDGPVVGGVEQLGIDDVPGFVAVMLENDPALQQIMNSIGIDTATLIEKALEILRQEQAAKGDKDVGDNRDKTRPSVPAPAPAPNPPPDTGTDPIQTPSPSPTPTPDPTPEPDEDVEFFDIALGGAALQKIFGETDKKIVLTGSASPTGAKKLEVAALFIPGFSSLDTNGIDLKIIGNLRNDGTLTLNGGSIVELTGGLSNAPGTIRFLNGAIATTSMTEQQLLFSLRLDRTGAVEWGTGLGKTLADSGAPDTDLGPDQPQQTILYGTWNAVTGKMESTDANNWTVRIYSDVVTSASIKASAPVKIMTESVTASSIIYTGANALIHASITSMPVVVSFSKVNVFLNGGALVSAPDDSDVSVHIGSNVRLYVHEDMLEGLVPADLFPGVAEVYTDRELLDIVISETANGHGYHRVELIQDMGWRYIDLDEITYDEAVEQICGYMADDATEGVTLYSSNSSVTSITSLEMDELTIPEDKEIHTIGIDLTFGKLYLEGYLLVSDGAKIYAPDVEGTGSAWCEDGETQARMMGSYYTDTVLDGFEVHVTQLFFDSWDTLIGQVLPEYFDETSGDIMLTLFDDVATDEGIRYTRTPAAEQTYTPDFIIFSGLEDNAAITYTGAGAFADVHGMGLDVQRCSINIIGGGAPEESAIVGHTVWLSGSDVTVSELYDNAVDAYGVYIGDITSSQMSDNEIMHLRGSLTVSGDTNAVKVTEWLNIEDESSIYVDQGVIVDVVTGAATPSIRYVHVSYMAGLYTMNADAEWSDLFGGFDLSDELLRVIDREQETYKLVADVGIAEESDADGYYAVTLVPEVQADAEWVAYNIVGGTEAGLQSLLNNPSVSGVNLYTDVPGQTTFSIPTLYIPTGKRLETQGMDLVIGGTLTVNGTLVLNRGTGDGNRDSTVTAAYVIKNGTIEEESGTFVNQSLNAAILAPAMLRRVSGSK